MTKRDRVSVGLALGGGGSRGSFQAGAIAALVTDLGLRPDVLAGTSAGSLNAIILAHARTPDEYPDMVERMLVTWTSLRSDSDMYVPRQWLADLTPGLRRSALEIAGGRPSLRSVLEVTRSIHGLPRVVRDLRAAGGSLYSLSPVEARIRRDLEPERVRASHAVVRLSLVALESGALRWADGAGAMYEEDATTPAAGGPVDLVDALLASAAFAPAFPPRRLAGETYVDGGFRTVIPVRAARALGAGPIVAVACARPGSGRPRPMAEADVLRVAIRTAALTLAEVASRDYEDLSRGPGFLVDPTVEVHGFLEVDPGRIGIDIDHGRLVAAERMAAIGGLDTLLAARGAGSPAVRDPDGLAASAALTEAITRLRIDAWAAEERLAEGRPKASAGGVLLEIRARKWLIRTAVAARAACPGPLPPRTDAWSAELEAHLPRIVVRGPWSSLAASNGGPIPAADPSTFVPDPFLLAVRGSDVRWLVADGRRRPVGAPEAVGSDAAPRIEADPAVAALVPDA